MAVQSDVEYFARLVDALEPWLDQVVIIGGWAHRLYRQHPLAQPLDYEPLGTFDTDIAVPLDLPATGEQIRARLLERDFREELMGDMQPPAAHYRVESGDNSFYAEFLTPLEGSAVKRGGRRDVTARVSGVSVQKLRYLELLLQNPWDVMIAPAVGYAQPFITYTAKTAWTFAMTSYDTYNWTAGRWTVIVNPIRVSKLVKLGPQRLSVGGALRCTVTSPQYQPKGCGLEFTFTPVYPAMREGS